jgi:hypothetical protein
LGIAVGRLFLGLGFALLQQFCTSALLSSAGLQVGLALQGLFVGVQRGFQLAAAGQGIASIVVGAACRLGKSSAAPA